MTENRSRVKVVAHRGASARAPENTLEAFLLAASEGADAVEMDVRLTRDGEAVCVHDEDLRRLTGKSGRVAELDATEVTARVVFPGGFGGAYSEARIPRFQSVLQQLPATLPLVVELKPESGTGPALLSAVTAEVARAEAQNRIRLISFDLALLERAAKEFQLGILVAGEDLARGMNTSRRLQARALHLPHRSITAAEVNASVQGGWLLNAWTANRADDLDRLLALGVDEITTDDPLLALKRRDRVGI